MTRDRNRIILAKFLAFCGDLAVFYFALGLTVFLRYHEIPSDILNLHLGPFSLVLLLWLFFGYVGGIYEFEIFRTNRLFVYRLNRLLLLQGVLMLAFFYFLPLFKISPKTNFIIFIAIFSICIYLWRLIFNVLVIRRKKELVLFFGTGKGMEEMLSFLKKNPQFAYSILGQIEGAGLFQPKAESANASLIVSSISFPTVQVQELLAKNDNLRFLSLSDLTRIVQRKIPLDEIDVPVFSNSMPKKFVYQFFKRIFDLVFSLISILILFPFFALIAIAIKLDSPGSVFYGQRRMGKNGKTFVLYKFRSMSSDEKINPDAQSSAPTWSSGSGDARVTRIGKLLRMSHIDELPQLFNILRADMSFVGPRPERPEFDEKLRLEIPHYDMRYLARPGVTGWAQINYGYVSSSEDAWRRLEFDFYYLLHQSFLLDLRIILKTLKRFFIPSA